MSYDATKKTTLKHLKETAARMNTELSAVKASVTALQEVGAEANVIAEIKVNGVVQKPSEKSVNITVPQTVAELDTESAYATKTYVGEQVAAADHLQRKKVANKEAIDLEAPDADKYIYMVPKTGGKNGDKYDEYLVIDGALEPVGDWAVDLSGYQQKEDGKGLSTNDYTKADKDKLGGIAEGATKVEASDTDGAIKVNGSDVQVVDIATDAEVTEMLNEVFGTGAGA